MTADSRPAPASAPPPSGEGGAAGGLALRGWRFTVTVLRAMHTHQALDAASAMAFHFFLSLIPLLVVLGYVLGLLVRQKGVEAFMAPVLDAAPDAATDIVRRELERLAGASASPIAPLGVVGFFWVASSGVHGLMNVFETALAAPRRPWWKKRAIASVWVLGSILAISVTASVALALDARVQELEDDPAVDVRPASPAPAVSHPHARAPAASSSAAAPRRLARPATHPVRKRVARLFASRRDRWSIVGVVLVLGVSGLAAFYRFAVEHPAGVQRRGWPGAFVAVSAFLLVSWGFGAYVSSLGSYALYYGSLAAVAVLLFWFYLSSLAMLLGAEVNAQLEGVRRNPSR